MEYEGRFAHRILFFQHNVSPLDNHLCLSITYLPIHLFFFIYKSSLSTKIFSGVAGIIVVLSCCTAVGKLCYRRTCCPFTLSIEDALVELMDLSHSLVPVDKLHQLATEAGFEMDLLTHFGTKVFPSKRSEELGFWIGLAQKKISVAFQKENLFSGRQICYKVHS